MYAYDPVGNRLGRGATSYVYDKADRLKSVNGVGYSSDANGNLTVRGTNGSFSYDQANRLKSANVAGALTAYAYDGDGKRTSKAVSGTTTSYLYDVNRPLPVLLEDGTRKYVWGLGLAYAIDSSNNVEVFHTDGLSSVRAITDGSGALVQAYQTDEFGVPALTEGTRAQPFGFIGEQRDAETGLVYLRARLYDPQLGRFVSRDPASRVFAGLQPPNGYAYVLNIPATYTDARGLTARPAQATPSAVNSPVKPGLKLQPTPPCLVALPIFGCIRPPEFIRAGRGTRKDEEPREQACSDELESCKRDAKKKEISVARSECYQGYALCLHTGGIFWNPGWRQGMGEPEWNRVWE